MMTDAGALFFGFIASGARGLCGLRLGATRRRSGRAEGGVARRADAAYFPRSAAETRRPSVRSRRLREGPEGDHQLHLHELARTCPRRPRTSAAPGDSRPSIGRTSSSHASVDPGTTRRPSSRISRQLARVQATFAPDDRGHQRDPRRLGLYAAPNHPAMVCSPSATINGQVGRHASADSPNNILYYVLRRVDPSSTRMSELHRP